MASFEDYDEFGNYIGADLDSEEEGAEVPHDDIAAAHAPQQQPLEGYDDGPMGADPGTALMEIDGRFHSWRKCAHFLNVVPHRACTQCCHFARE